MNPPLGNEVVSLLSVAQHNVLIVAPFIRSNAFSRLLESIPDGVETTVVSRWRLTDLLAGASDLGVYDLTEEKGIPLYLRSDLHAKVYAADERCLVGSANITSSALGWRMPANMEILTPLARNVNQIVEFEAALFSGAVRASREQRDQLAKLLEKFSGQFDKITDVEIDSDAISYLPPNWIPSTRNPDELFLVYNGNNDFSRSALKAMRQDMGQLCPVPGMDEDGFREWVATAICQTPLISKVLQQIDEEGEVTQPALSNLLEEIGVELQNYKTRDVLEVLERWLSYFLPTRYETARDSIKLIKAKKL